MQETQSWGPPWRHDRRSGRFRGRESRGGGGPGPATAVIAGFFHVVGANNLAHDGGVFRPMTFWVYTLLLVGPFALLVRGPFPVATFATAAAASIGFATFAAPSWGYAVAPAIGVFRLAKKGRRTAAIVSAATAYTAYVLVCWVFADRLGLPPGVRPDARVLVLLAIGLVLLVFLGGAAKVRGEHMLEIMKVRAERQRAQEEQERRQASEERLRIARELHDVLGHHLSLINVQAGVGLHLMDNHPEQAREALAAIKTASSEALREVRSVLGVLRTEDEAAPRQPALGLSRLDDLTAGAGLPVETKVSGEVRPLPAEVDRAAYRIVQEALTNVRRHAGPGATASIAVDYLPTALHLAIRNDSAQPPPPPAAAGPPRGEGVRLTERLAVGLRLAGDTARSAADTARPAAATARPAADTARSAADTAGPAGDTARVGDAARAAVGAVGAGEAGGEAARGDSVVGEGHAGGEHAGSGIVGMRARAQSLGGTLEAGPVDGGFLVSVLLPTPDSGEESE